MKPPVSEYVTKEIYVDKFSNFCILSRNTLRKALCNPEVETCVCLLNCIEFVNTSSGAVTTPRNSHLKL
jgi:hypothetical protein